MKGKPSITLVNEEADDEATHSDIRVDDVNFEEDTANSSKNSKVSFISTSITSPVIP